jgi:hypothetical protein
LSPSSLFCPYWSLILFFPLPLSTHWTYPSLHLSTPLSRLRCRLRCQIIRI